MDNALILKSRVDKLNYLIYTDRKSMGLAAAKAVRDILLNLQDRQDKIRIVFASAPSQNEFLHYLSSFKDICWSKVDAFHMDEYIGLNKGSSQTFSHYIKEHLLDKVKPNSENYINSEAEDIDKECERYGSLIKADGIDLVCLGVGENGHIAFNDPEVADFYDPKVIKKVKLDEKCRMQQVHDGCFHNIDSVPKYALTLTIPTLCSAKHMVCIVPSATKKDAINSMLKGPITSMLPASILRKHNNSYLFLDKDAGKDLI